MSNVGAGDDASERQVQTIELWYSQRRQLWVVERQTDEGHPVGTPHSCLDEAEAWDCLEAWLRASPEAEPLLPMPTAGVADTQRHAA